MGKKNRTVSIFVTDEAIGLFVMGEKNPEQSEYARIPLSVGVVENGYIQDASAFFRPLQNYFKLKKIGRSTINLVLNEQNILIRKMTVHKAELQKRNLDDFLREQNNKTLHFPFREPLITHYVESENDEDLNLLLFIADLRLIQDFYDVYERLGAKNIVFTLPSLALRRLFLGKHGDLMENTMIVSVLERTISITVTENSVPIFAMIDDCEGNDDAYFDTIDNFVDRIANYYRYNIRKGTDVIMNILVFNLTDRIDQKRFAEKMGSRLSSFLATIPNLPAIDPRIKDMPKAVYPAYASGITLAEAKETALDIDVQRPDKRRMAGNFLLVAALALFSLISIVYIPFHLMAEDIAIQQNIVDNLQQELQALQSEIPPQPSFTLTERQYSDAYDFLVSQRAVPSDKLADLVSVLGGSVGLQNYRVDSGNRQITLTLFADSEGELDEYVIAIYEAFGITETPSSARWIDGQPVKLLLAADLMEVTLYYAD